MLAHVASIYIYTNLGRMYIYIYSYTLLHGYKGRYMYDMT